MQEPITFRLAELERRLNNLVRYGTVAEADYGAARVRVRSGELLTGWLPWLTQRAGGDRVWHAPEVGEQVLLISPCGDPAQGLVLPAIYQAAHPAPAASSDKRRVEFADGGFTEYDRESGKWTVSAEGLAQLIGKGTVELIGADGAAVKGIVQGDCLCCFTGKPHPMISATVKGSL